MIIIFLPSDEIPDFDLPPGDDPIWKCLLIALPISWLLTYCVIGYFHGYDAWGLKGVSFICGNFIAMPITFIFETIYNKFFKRKK
jgi:hypothetical protein